MKNIVDKLKIIGLKEHGYSNRETARKTSTNMKTVAKYWNEYLKHKAELEVENADYKEVQEKITQPPKYNCENRIRRKFTEEMSIKLNEILESEKQKDKLLGSSHKQQLTKKQIHQMMVAAGFNISLSTITNDVNRIKKASRECFIRQEYSLGDRLEYV